MDEVLVVVIADAAIQGVGREEEEESSGLPDPFQQIFVESAHFFLLDVEKYFVAQSLQLNFQKSGMVFHFRVSCASHT